MTTQKTVTVEDVERDATELLATVRGSRYATSTKKREYERVERLRDTAAQVPALQARIGDLEARLKRSDEWAEAEGVRAFRAESERDALQARVAELEHAKEEAGRFLAERD